VSIDTKLTGVAGEHHVCSMLARYLWAPSLMRDGLERTDILAVHSQTRRMIEVQVKSLRGPGLWRLGNKGIVPAITDREWYVMVRLTHPPDAPESYVIPRDHVAAATWIAHMNWLTDPAARPGARNAGIGSAMLGADVFGGYRDRWEDLHTPTAELPVLLPLWKRETMRGERVGLPAGHPWRDTKVILDWPGPARD
jgi:hypothetical protein